MSALESTEEETEVSVKKKNYPLRIGERLFNRIDEHVFFLKTQGNDVHTKQKWITEAIKEKLSKENDKRLPQVPKSKSIFVKLEEPLSKELEERINFIKKMKGSYSLKTWLI